MEDLIYVDVKFLLKYGLYLYEEKKCLVYDIYKKYNILQYNVKSVKCMFFFLVKVQFIYICMYFIVFMYVEVNIK